MSTARSRALTLLARSPRTEAEIERALGEEGKEAVSWLKELGFVDDRRYALDYVAFRAKKYGRLRLEHALKKKGVSRDIIKEIMPRPEEEQGAAEALLHKKFHEMPKDARERAKAARFLASRGFSAAAVMAALKVSCS